MESLSTSVWQRRGACTIFDQQSLGPLFAGGAGISLRQALAWSKALPETLIRPGNVFWHGNFMKSARCRS